MLMSEICKYKIFKYALRIAIECGRLNNYRLMIGWMFDYDVNFDISLIIKQKNKPIGHKQIKDTSLFIIIF